MDENLIYWVWLSSLTDIAYTSKRRLLQNVGTPMEIFNKSYDDIKNTWLLSDSDLKKLFDEDKRRECEASFLKCIQNDIKILPLEDPDYPQRLKNIPDPPLCLFVKGELPDVDNNLSLSLIGTRNAGIYGIKMARRLGYGLGKTGIITVTGLGAGIETAGVEAALAAGGTCIAVLGTDHLSAHGEHLNAIIKNGAAVSEYPPSTRVHKRFFRARNRINSGLASGVLVIEAPEQSGTNLFVETSAQQGRDLFVVPGNADAHSFVSSNNMIKNGAVPVVTIRDILDEYPSYGYEVFPEAEIEDREIQSAVRRLFALDKIKKTAKIPEPDKSPFDMDIKETDKKTFDKNSYLLYICQQKNEGKLSQEEYAILSAIDEKDTHADRIIEKTGLPVPVVMAKLTILCIKGYIIQSPGKFFSVIYH